MLQTLDLSFFVTPLPLSSPPHPSRRIFQREKTFASGDLEVPSCVYVDPDTKAMLFVGGKAHAKNNDWLTKHNVGHVETCLDHSLRDERFALAAGVGSHQFNIGHHVGRIESFRNALRHTQTALRAGRSVLVHCEAGVHRAATASALCFMIIHARSEVLLS